MLIIGSKGSGAVTLAELIKSSNPDYTSLRKLSISPSYNPSVEAMRRSFGLVEGESQQVKAGDIINLTSSTVKPSGRGLTLSIKGGSHTSYDNLVNKALDVLMGTDGEGELLVSVSDIDLLKASTVVRFSDLTKNDRFKFILSSTNLRIRSEELMSTIDCLIVTRVQGVRLLYSKFNQRFSIGLAEPKRLSEGGRGIYHLFMSDGRMYAERIKTGLFS